jgi:signal transduction histidine kinase
MSTIQVNTSREKVSSRAQEFAHDARSPLNAINLIVALLQRSPLDMVSKDNLAMISQQTAYLTTVINSYLESFAEQEQTELDIYLLLEECIQVAKPQAEAAAVELVFPSERPPFTVCAVRNQIQRVIMNLITNAIKYNKRPGRVTVTLRVEYKDFCPSIVVSVSDTGMGIEPEHQAHIFERSYRIPQHAQKVEGTGLGLAICKQIVEAHGGRIGLESEAGVGTNFYFTLPLVV